MCLFSLIVFSSVQVELIAEIAIDMTGSLNLMKNC